MIVHSYARLDEGENHNSTMWEVRDSAGSRKGVASAELQRADGNVAKVGIWGIVVWGLIQKEASRGKRTPYRGKPLESQYSTEAQPTAKIEEEARRGPGGLGG